ncbi:MAG: Ni/Fe hydrogenase subunit alpha [Pirellulales bacterium]|nr:Ni/Fe hydrogenase subunit alpha [Pirellulales bacterium]
MTDRRVIEVPALTRVEGEGGLKVVLHDGQVDDVQLNIYEPPRLFEALLRGRPLDDVPDITARICGICPVAYQMSSVHALEAALGLRMTPELRSLRRLLYCGEWIESHALHIHLLHAPDFLGYESGLAMAADHPEAVARGLALRKLGNRLLEALGGRAVHPVSVAVGGFYGLPRADVVQALVADFAQGLELACDAARWVASFSFPDFDRSYEMVALVHPDEYAMNEGELRSTAGLACPVTEFEQRFEEYQVPHSTALQARRRETGTCYLVGPLARVALSRERLAPRARALADELLPEPATNVFRGIVARAVEVVHAFEEALELLRHYRPVWPPRVPWQPREGTGCAATEAPRGTLYHRYRVSADGTVAEARIVPPTSQNQAQIEDDLRAWLPRVLPAGEQRAALDCERLVRSYDPCISCAAHFLRVTWESV